MTNPFPPTPSPEVFTAVSAAMSRYVWALDTADIDALMSIFTPDGLFEDTRGTIAEGREALRGMFGGLMARDDFRGRQHHIDSLLIEPRGDDIGCRAYWTVTKWHRDAGEKIFEVLGWSNDLLRWDGDELFFVERRVHYWNDAAGPYRPLGG